MSRDYGKRDPSSHRTPAQIKKMDRGYNATTEQRDGRNQRNKARRKVRDAKGAAAIAGKDVNHKRMVKDGGSNAMSNLNIQSKHKNRGWERDH
jgi:hypothetical protein